MNSRDQRPLWGAITAALLGVLVVTLIVAVVQTWTAVDAIRESQRVNVSTIDYIRDCTSPGGDCFKEGQKRTAEAVSGINAGTLRIAVAVESCRADGITEQRALAACTVKRTQPADEGDKP